MHKFALSQIALQLAKIPIQFLDETRLGNRTFNQIFTYLSLYQQINI